MRCRQQMQLAACNLALAFLRGVASLLFLNYACDEQLMAVRCMCL